MRALTPKKIKRMGENRKRQLVRMRDEELLEIGNEYRGDGFYRKTITSRETEITFILGVESADPEAHWGDLQ